MIDRTAEFKTRPDDWRIEAVIHDGSWYDIKKWARVAKVKPAYLEDWLSKNEERFNIIRSEQGESFRVGYDEVLDWYGKQDDISIEDKIIPKNYPPRLWDGMTEVEAFLNVPRRETSTLTVSVTDDQLLKKVEKALCGVARVRFERNGKYRAFGLSDRYMQQVLQQKLTKEEIESLNIKRRKGMLHRELTDFSKEFVEEALTFYLPFSRHILRKHLSTLQIYLPDENDIDSQIIAWVVAAMRKFDETQPVPFSGYLSNVLRFWPYDLPDEFLGKELSDFQRKRQKAIQALTVEKETAREFSNQQIADKMEISLDDYIRLESQHKTWLAERNATTLNWSDSANEKSGELVGYHEASVHDVDLAHKISVAAVNATLKTSLFDEGSLVIESIDKNPTEEIMKLLGNLSPEFKKELGYELIKAGVLK